MTHAEPSELTGFRKWLPLAFLVLGLLVVVIDSTVLNVSIVPIVRDLNIDLTQIQWVISAYSLTLGALLITGGRLGDVFGRKRMFMLGAVIFAAGSVLASYSTNFSTLLIGESLLEGVGAALMSPATSSLLVAIYKGRDRAIAYGFWGSAAALGIAIGPLLGGYFATHSTWRWSFRINLFVVIVLLLGSYLLPKDTDFKDHRRFDWLGVLLSAGGVLGVMFSVIESSTYGIFHEKAPLVLLGQAIRFGGYSAMPVLGLLGLGILGLFMLYEGSREKRGLPLLVSPHIFEKKQFSAGAISMTIFALAQGSLLFTLAIFFQTVIGLDSLQTGYVYLPIAATLLIAAPLAGYFSSKVSPRTLIYSGFILMIIQAILIRYTLTTTTTVWSLTPALLLAGIGVGFLSSQITNLTLSAVPVTDAGEASGIMQTMRQVGASLGIAITGAIILNVSATSLKQAIQTSGDLTEAQRSTALIKVQKEGSDLEFVQEGKDALGTTIKGLKDQAIVEGNQNAFNFIILFAIFGLLTATQLPKKKES